MPTNDLPWLQASKIPAFYVAFVVTPYASNASELVSSLIFAMRKHKKNISLTFSQVGPLSTHLPSVDDVRNKHKQWRIAW